MSKASPAKPMDTFSSGKRIGHNLMSHYIYAAVHAGQGWVAILCKTQGFQFISLSVIPISPQFSSPWPYTVKDRCE